MKSSEIDSAGRLASVGVLTCTPEERAVLDACHAFTADDFEEHDSLKYLVGGEKQHTLIEAIEAMNLAADDYGLASNPMTARRAAEGMVTVISDGDSLFTGSKVGG